LSSLTLAAAGTQFTCFTSTSVQTLTPEGRCRKFSSAAMCTGESVGCVIDVTGTRGYMAPEVIRKEEYDAKIDVYSGAMVVCSMLFCRMLTYADVC
jgi:serine/threonine protein kinase